MDQGQLSRYRQALLDVNGVAAPTASPAPISSPDNASVMANLQNLSRGGFQADAASAATAAAGAASSAQADQEEANARLRLQEEENKAAALLQQKKDLEDPSKYRQEINDNGGYDYYDPTGNQIDAKQFSGATGKHLTEVLKKSQDPADQQFVNDYKDIEALGKIMNSGDKKGLDKFYEKHPTFKTKKDDTYSKIVTDFRGYYPQFFNKAPAATVQTKYGDKAPSSIGGGGSGVAKFLSAIFGS